ncbi:MAG: MFS transporter [Saprospiraceae bacterium]|nr:MFS transporter [Bacteroidia bacterium]NNE13937.1 MFS transporter [Saprospiraceae bacterium]NNL91619.1 MFS transporter [Saprospiraceae bacterium]
MSFGFLGIQFGFALQGGSMSRIFQTLGATKDEMPMLWIFAPIAGLLVQPIIGYMSDRTWSVRFGRRKPYFLIGALLASSALIFMPYSPVLWVAVGCLFLLDASINISMEPFRALVADVLPESQRSYGFVVQTLVIGVGTWVASQLPWALNQLGVSNEAASNVVPNNVKMSFLIGGIVFILSIIYTVLTTKEYPPEDMDAFLKEKEETAGFFNGLKEIIANIKNMPETMLKLGVIQFFSWFAFFTMWSMATPALTEHVFDAPKPEKDAMSESAYSAADLAYNNAADIISSAMGTYGLSSMLFALILTFITRKIIINRKYVHMGSLIVGGLGFILMLWTKDGAMLNLCFALIGISWASILSMPYAMLSSTIDPKKMGIYMGLFNMFIVIPQICAAVGGINFLYKNIFGDQIINTMLLAGLCLVIAGLSNFLITDPKVIRYHEE